MCNQKKEQECILSLKSVSLGTKMGNVMLLNNISFDVKKGDLLGIIGASGAGKTTLFRLLNRLIEPSEGTIYFNNKELKNMPSIGLRKQIVLVPQEPKLLGMTVQQALTYPLKLSKLSSREIKLRVGNGISQLQIPEEWLERTELQLSVGQRQLVAIARGLVMQAEILLLDEPTSALDIGKANFLLEVLRELTDNNAITILIISHQLDLLKNYANRVVYLEKGYLIKEDLTDNIDWQKINDNLKQSKIDESIDDFDRNE